MTQQEFYKRYSYDAKSDKLGGGGFARVFKAWDSVEDCYVALKIQPVGINPDLRLRKEVECATELHHPNIARYKACYTFDTFDGETDIAVMSYYEHGSLDKLLCSQRLTDEEREDILTQILDGISFLHSHGIIHRDLKPQNILILYHGGRYVPKITDFGISKQLDDGVSSVVHNSVVGGTYAYASPEQLKEATIRKNTDLWSFGVIAYQMFVGVLPFNCGKFSPTSQEGHSERLRQMTSGVLPTALNNVPEPWQRLIRMCLVVDNTQRLAHVEDCMAIIGIQPTAIEKPVEVKATDERTIPEKQPKYDNRSNRKSRWWLWLLLLLLIAVGGFVGYMMSGDDTPAPTPIPESAPTNYTETAYDIDMTMVWVEGGSFKMGSNSGDNDEKPIHNVTLDGYWIGATEVTQAQWESVMGTDIRQQRDTADRSWPLRGEGSDYPMYYVNYDEAKEFCRRLSERTGRTYTLPTEAQWEYAARGGRDGVSDNYTYSGSNNIGSVAWYYGNSGDNTNPVGRKNPNQLGLYDMSGNVWEWCLDWYGDYSSSNQTNPTGPSSGDYQILRGGSWGSYGSCCRVSNRDYGSPSFRYYYYGFRVVCLP